MNAIVVADRSWAIGRDGGLLFSLPTDMKRFRSLTMGGAVILGRKTLATFPGGRPLKNRRNLILSRNPHFQAEGAEVFPSVEELVKQADGDAFVIGGASVYEQLLPYCDTAYITKIHAGFPADTHFPNLDQSEEWKVTEESESLEQDGISYHYVTYSRIK